jgi:phage replication-related protein YjqB (UPF0714/DUF867 family)
MSTFTARVVPNSGVPSGPRREHCTAHYNQITTIGRNKGQQVRIERYAADEITLLDLALYTVIDVHNQEADIVFVGYRGPESTYHDLRDRLGLSTTHPFICKINSEVPISDLTGIEAEENSEFVERLMDNGHHRDLIVIAPHGGNIEIHTDEQAERVAQQLLWKNVSSWVCKGFKQGGGAYDRWHITSTDISEESFPKLKTVMGRHFQYAMAFHGWGHDSICIGGSAPTDLKYQIKGAVESATFGSGIVVASDEDGGCPGDFNGNDPRNIVNRLATYGIQVEQSIQARTDYGIQIANAVAGVLGQTIQLCTAPL